MLTTYSSKTNFPLSLTYYSYSSSAGILLLGLNDTKLIKAFFANEQKIKSYNVAALPEKFITEFVLQGTPFQLKVWQATLRIPAGSTKSYQELAQEIGNPRAYRAVAQALAHNQLAYFVPCHRVIHKNGSLGGYKWDVERKRFLLQAEILDFKVVFEQ